MFVKLDEQDILMNLLTAVQMDPYGARLLLDFVRRGQEHEDELDGKRVLLDVVSGDRDQYRRRCQLARLILDEAHVVDLEAIADLIFGRCGGSPRDETGGEVATGGDPVTGGDSVTESALVFRSCEALHPTATDEAGAIRCCLAEGHLAAHYHATHGLAWSTEPMVHGPRA
jgi:hypothetical protein